MIDIVFVELLGVLLSTMASYLHALAVLLVQDVIEPCYEPLFAMKMEDKRKSIYARVVVALVGMVAMALTAWGKKVILEPRECLNLSW